MAKQRTNQKFKKPDLKIEKLLPGLEKNVLLKNETTLRIGGKAQYFFKAQTKQDLIKVLKVAKKINLPFFILGGGSNLLVSDKGYKGLVIKVKSQKSKVKISSQRSKIIEIESGALLNKIVTLALKNNLTGIEWAVGIPGTIGGAIWGNSGAFGHSMGEIVKAVEVFDTKDLRFKIYDLRNCKFGYRDSIFKRNKNQSAKQSFVLGRAHKIMCSDLIILSVEFQLKKGNPKNIKKKIKECLRVRKEKIPYQFSAGSVFKNIKKQDLNRKQLKLIPFQKIKGGKIPVAYLIEESGLKGKAIGEAQISEKHANFIINLGKAKSKDVLKLIDLAKDKVKKKFGIVLEKEIESIP